MKPTLRVGAHGLRVAQVGADQTITLGNDRNATVLSTPAMIDLMEHAARAALRAHLEPSEESVGVDVRITHSSATPPKSEVTAEATVTAIEKNVVTFDVVARDHWGEIGRGTHRRAVIDTSRFADRLAVEKPTSISSSNTLSIESLRGFRWVACRQAGNSLLITLNRPEKRNAISAQMTGELEQIVGWRVALPTSAPSSWRVRRQHSAPATMWEICQRTRKRLDL